MKPDTLPPTIPFLSVPLDYHPPALPSLSRRIASTGHDWHKTAARLLLALYVALIAFSAIRLHRHFVAQRAAQSASQN